MNILIKGMEMPTSCLHGECPIAGEYCGLWEEKHWKSPDEPYRKRHPRCPLIPVPPHGRLIDADALKEAFCGNCFADEKPMECSEPCMDMKIILEAPTIIPAEEEVES